MESIIPISCSREQFGVPCNVQNQIFLRQIDRHSNTWMLVRNVGFQPSFLQNCWIRICILQDPKEIHRHNQVGETLVYSLDSGSQSVVTGLAVSVSTTESETLGGAQKSVYHRPFWWFACMVKFGKHYSEFCWFLCPQKSYLSGNSVCWTLNCVLSRCHHLPFPLLPDWVVYCRPTQMAWFLCAGLISMCWQPISWLGLPLGAIS